MKAVGTPDLLSSLTLARRGAQVSADLARAGEELTTGRKADPVAAAGGDPARLYAVERALARNEGYADAITLAEGRASVSQSALGAMRGAAETIGVDLGAAVERGDRAAARLEARAGKAAFADVVGALNTTFGGRSLFAGAAVERSAVAPAETMLAEIEALTAAETTSAGAVAAVESYFDDPAGGYRSGTYLGADQDAPAAELGEGERFDFAVRADAPEIRDLLKGLALAAVASDGAFAGEAGETDKIVAAAATRTINAKDGVIARSAELGVAEARIETAKARSAAETATLEQARAGIVAKDELAAASEFQRLESQLQAVYTVTARLSRLSLTNFLGG